MAIVQLIINKKYDGEKGKNIASVKSICPSPVGTLVAALLIQHL